MSSHSTNSPVPSFYVWTVFSSVRVIPPVSTFTCSVLNPARLPELFVTSQIILEDPPVKSGSEAAQRNFLGAAMNVRAVLQCHNVHTCSPVAFCGSNIQLEEKEKLSYRVLAAASRALSEIRGSKAKGVVIPN